VELASGDCGKLGQRHGVVPTEVRVRTLLGRLLGGVRAISAYDGDPLGDGCTLDSWVSIFSIISVTCALSISICWVKVFVSVSS